MSHGSTPPAASLRRRGLRDLHRLAGVANRSRGRGASSASRPSTLSSGPRPTPAWVASIAPSMSYCRCSRRATPRTSTTSNSARGGRWRSNVWTYPGASSLGSDARRGLKDHPTVKPTAMLEDALLDLTNRGEIVLDPFLGSGSTLIAANRTVASAAASNSTRSMSTSSSGVTRPRRARLRFSPRPARPSRSWRRGGRWRRRKWKWRRRGRRQRGPALALGRESSPAYRARCRRTNPVDQPRAITSPAAEPPRSSHVSQAPYSSGAALNFSAIQSIASRRSLPGRPTTLRGGSSIAFRSRPAGSSPLGSR